MSRSAAKALNDQGMLQVVDASVELIFAGDAAKVGDQRLGGKGAGLARLHTLGLNVPAFCVVPSEAFRSHLQKGGVPARLGDAVLRLADLDLAAPDGGSVIAKLSEELREAIERESLEHGVAAAIAASLTRLGPGPYAVRSSMVGEDSASHSFAGQLDTFLYQCSVEDVLDSIVRCWGSAFGERALVYAARAGIAPASVRMGVVVQQMVDADVSGVLFTVNPVSGRLDECLLTAAWGQGEGIVSGLCDTDEYTWTPAGERSVVLADKDVQVRRAPSGRGTSKLAVAVADRGRRALTAAQVREVCSTGLTIARASGAPMDVEWSYQNGTLHVLQARPVTSVRPAPDRDGPRIVWDNSNIQESYCGVTTPLTFSFASYAYRTVYRQFARALGVSNRTLADLEPVVRNMLGFVQGRVYYNINNWYRLLSILPGFGERKEDMESLMGVEEPVDFVVDRPPSFVAALRTRAELAVVAARLLPRLAGLDREIERFTAHFWKVVSEVDRPHLAAASLSSLHATAALLLAELLDEWEAPIHNDTRVMISSGRVRRLLQRRCGADAKRLYADLMGGIEGLESVEPTRQLMALGSQARGDESLALAVRTGTLASLRCTHPSFARRIDEYIDRYGDRCMGELKLETISLREDPTFVLDVIRNYIDRPDLDPKALSRRERERYETALDAVSTGMSRRERSSLRKSVEAARHALKARESLRLLRTIAFGIARDVYRAMGSRLHEAGALRHPRDVFYLTTDELSAFVEGRAVGVDLAPIVAARKAEYAAYASVDAPNRFETRGAPYVGNDLTPVASAIDHDAEVLRGLGCCSGSVEAPVRIIFSPKDDLSVNGKILCTLRTDPGWAPLFPTARGLVVERGSALSHSAVVARELGIPAVVGVRGVTKILVDGETVRLDGGAGSIERRRGRA